MTLYLDLSALQSVPAANLNRDDLGSPKQVRYGNASRIRVSSQSWKRAIRLGVEQDLGEKAARTRLVPAKVQHALQKADWPAELAAFAGAQVAASAGKKGIGTEAAGHTSVLLFLPEAAIDELAAVCAEHRQALEAAQGKKKPGQVLPPHQIEQILKRRTASISCCPALKMPTRAAFTVPTSDDGDAPPGGCSGGALVGKVSFSSARCRCFKAARR
ncbi:type I-E CRISPR-associated protein Cas7/Cse4/CasC [Streptomyces sp. NPDC006265]|uniref:type I-E CRISPR-associated protein Cas7/Cse4/CasC n=1 Tax=Streptomyces sp. NPDC006265 TaxID=3156740 RepID=UPI0033A21EAC